MGYLKTSALLVAFVFLCGFGGGQTGGGGGGGAPTGVASGDLGGSYPNPNVTGLTHAGGTTLNNVVIGGTTPVAGTFSNVNQVQAPTVTANAVTCNWNNGAVCAFTNNASTTVTFTNLPTNQYIYTEWTTNCNQCTEGFGANVSFYQVSSDTVTTSPSITALASQQVTLKNVFWSDGTAAWLDGVDNVNSTVSKTVDTRTLKTEGTFNMPATEGGNAISSFPRTAISFSIAQTSISTGVNLACTKVVKAITIENDEGLWTIGASCNGQVIRVYDCGTSAPANAGCSGGTQLTTNTYSATAGTVTDGTVSQSSVAAGHYMCAQIQASGSCTTMYGQETLMARPQ